MALAQDDDPLALEYLERAVALAPQDAQATQWLGYLEERAGNGEQAISLWEQHDSARFLVTLGDCLLQRGEQESAEHYYKLAARLDDWYAYARLGDLYADQQRIDEALTMYSNVVSRTEQPNELITAYFGLAKMHTLQGNPEEAQRLFEKVYELQPTSYVASEIGLFLGSRAVQDFERSSQWFHEWARLQPNSPDPYRVLGKNALAMGEPDEALRFLEAALQREGKGADLYFDLGTAYERLGQLERSREIYEYVLTLAPNHEGAQARLQILQSEEEQ
jgi:tetratricopeptide (TPR) repeat protein